MPVVSLDEGDIRLLRALQMEGRLTNQELAQRCGMSTSPAWRRIRRLEEEGVIQGYRAVLNPRRLGLGVNAFVRIGIDRHSEAEALEFETEVMRLQEVISCHSVTGDHDFFLQVVAADLDAYADFSMRIIRRLPGMRSMHTNFALKEIKPAGLLPISQRTAEG